MTGYGRFARFYDDVMGERRQARTFIQELIHENAPEAKSVLDLACGTCGAGRRGSARPKRQRRRATSTAGRRRCA